MNLLLAIDNAKNTTIEKSSIYRLDIFDLFRKVFIL